MIDTERLSLQPIEPKHLDNTRKWANDPIMQEKILRYMPVTKLQQRRWYENVLFDKSKVVFAITMKKNGPHVGNTGFYNIDGVHRRGEFWILIGAAQMVGKGFGGEVTRAMLRYGYKSLNLNRIYLHVDKRNAAAVKCYTDCGFKIDGCLRQHYYLVGRYIDLLVMSVLRSEYHVQAK